jgi:hypothetical protein
MENLKMVDILDKFRTKYKLANYVLDSCGDKILASWGYRGLRHPEDANHIFEWDSTRLGAVISFGPDTYDGPGPERAWGFCKKRLLETGCELHNDGDFEGIFRFNPSNAAQCKAIIKEVKPRRASIVSPKLALAGVQSQFVSKAVA